MNNLNTLLTAFENVISKQEKLNLTVSKSSIGWHIEHIFLTTTLVIEALNKSNPSNYKWRFNVPKLIVFTFKKIPRGRAKAPKIATPETFNEQILREHFKSVMIKVQELNNIDKDKYFKHPFFGHLKLNEAIKFLEIHAEHHLKIVHDILNK